jgi:hypothetical protein
MAETSPFVSSCSRREWSRRRGRRRPIGVLRSAIAALLDAIAPWLGAGALCAGVLVLGAAAFLAGRGGL